MYADPLMRVHCRANQQLCGIKVQVVPQVAGKNSLLQTTSAVDLLQNSKQQVTLCVFLNMQYSIPGTSVCYNTLRLYIIRDTQHDLDNI